MHAFVVRGLQVDGELRLSLPGTRSFQIDCRSSESPLEVRVISVDLADYLDGLGIEEGRARAGEVRVARDSEFGDPRTAALVEITRCDGNTAWTREYLLTALRLFCEGDFYIAGDIVMDTGGSTAGGTWLYGFDYSSITYQRDVHLDEACVAELAGHVSELHRTVDIFHDVPALSISLRYFLRSYQERRLRNDYGRHALSYQHAPLEDIVLRLSIALEALLLGRKTRDPKTVIARRAVRLLRAGGTDAKLVGRLCRWAYEVRSGVAHGSFTGFDGLQEPVPPGGLERTDPAYAAMLVRQVVRACIISVAGQITSSEELAALLGGLNGGPPGPSRAAWLGILPWPRNPRSTSGPTS